MFVTDNRIPEWMGGGGGVGGVEGEGEKGWNGREVEFVIPVDRPVPIDCVRKMLESCLLECHANSC